MLYLFLMLGLTVWAFVMGGTWAAVTMVLLLLLFPAACTMAAIWYARRHNLRELHWDFVVFSIDLEKRD